MQLKRQLRITERRINNGGIISNMTEVSRFLPDGKLLKLREESAYPGEKYLTLMIVVEDGPHVPLEKSINGAKEAMALTYDTYRLRYEFDNIIGPDGVTRSGVDHANKYNHGQGVACMVYGSQKNN